MTFESLASLASATADLALVQDVIGAIRASDADAAAANITPAASVARSRPEYTAITVRHDVYETSTDSCKSPCYRPCNNQSVNPAFRHHFTPPHWSQRLALEPVVTESAAPVEARTSIKSPIQAPWEQLPWNQPARQIVQVKIVQSHTDILTKGSLLDMFI